MFNFEKKYYKLKIALGFFFSHKEKVSFIFFMVIIRHYDLQKGMIRKAITIIEYNFEDINMRSCSHIWKVKKLQYEYLLTCKIFNQIKFVR